MDSAVTMRTPPGCDADVIVTGAGPAGAAAARALAVAGIDVMLIDKAAFPRYKPCGGGISIRALARFPWLRQAISAIDQHTASTLHLEGPDGESVEISSPEPCVLLVSRREFDQALLGAALDAGARLTTGVEVTQVRQQPEAVELQARDGRILRAPLVIGADGVHSVIAKRSGLNLRWDRSKIALDMMEETDALQASRPDVLWIAYGYRGFDGYAYIFPKSRKVNVGLGCLLSYFDQRVGERPEQLQQALVEQLLERRLLHGSRDPDAFTPYLIPVGGPLARTGDGRLLLAGDAGGFVHGVTAEGIYYAMVSGDLAAKAIVTCGTDARSIPRVYQRLWRHEIGAELADAQALQRLLFADRDAVRAVVRAARQAGTLSSAVPEFVQGKRSWASVRRQMLWRHPAAAWRIARHRREREEVAS
jgi:geranylgeranyl reductase family protein